MTLLSTFQSLVALQQVRIVCSYNHHLCIAQEDFSICHAYSWWLLYIKSLLIADGSDFLLPTELTFDVGAKDGTIKNITIHILDDDIVEGTESFNITDSAARPCPNQFVTNIIIMDNDCK